MRTLTPELWDILASKLQVGDSGHRARLEVGVASPGTATDDPWVVTLGAGAPTLNCDGAAAHFSSDGVGVDEATMSHAGPGAWSSGADFDMLIEGLMWDDANANHQFEWSVGANEAYFVALVYRNLPDGWVLGVTGAATFDEATFGALTPNTNYKIRWQHKPSLGYSRARMWAATDTEPSTWDVTRDPSGDGAASTDELVGFFQNNSGSPVELVTSQISFNGTVYDNFDRTTTSPDMGTPSSLPTTSSSATFSWTSYPIESASTDKSYGADSDSMSATLPNQDGTLNPLVDDPVINHDTPVRLFQWYGDPANEVLTFTGLGNAITDHREPHKTDLRALDRMKLLLDESFISVTAPQGLDEDGAVLTPSNGVWVNYQAVDIANDLLDMAGWPWDKRDITPTNYVVDYFAVALADSFAGALRRLFNLPVYEPSVDEDGVYQAHPRPSVLTGVDTDTPVTAVASFSGANEVYVIDAGLDDQGLKTRVNVIGPAATAPTETWDELWHYNAIAHPNGIWANPDDLPGYVWVIDGHTRKVYRLDQSTGAVTALSPALSSNSLAGGMDGNDPTNTTYLWVLETPWHNTYDGLSSSGDPSLIRKVRISDWTTVASHSLGSAHWSAIAQADDKLYVTNLSSNSLRILNTSDFSTVDTISLPSDPTGVTASDTELWVFLGSTISVRLLSDPSTETTTHPIPGAGGGDLDPTDATVMYVDVPSLGLVYKYQLLIPGTPAIGASVIDYNLEDALGARAGIEPRTHDGCPNSDDPHPYQVRLEVVTDDKLVSNTQAQDTGSRLLALLARRRRNVQIGIIANPGIQKGDPVSVNDPPSGLVDQLVMVQTYTTNQSGGTYLGVISGPLWVTDY